VIPPYLLLAFGLGVFTGIILSIYASFGTGVRAQLITIINQGRTTLEAIDELKAIVSQLVNDTSVALTDISAKLTALAANQADPAVTQDINEAVAALTTLDANIKAADPGQQNPPAAIPPAA
jgi:hypothetical protein